MLDWATLTAAAPQLAGIIIMVVFVLEMGKRQDMRDSQRDVAFISALKERDTEWRAWMQMDRDRSASGLLQVAAELKSLASVVAATHSLVKQHDIYVRGELHGPTRRDAD